MTLPHNPIKYFYEGNDPAKYDEFSGMRWNVPFRELLENDIYLQKELDDLTATSHIALRGSVNVYPDTRHELDITNFDSFSTYSAQSNQGVASIEGEKVVIDVKGEFWSARAGHAAIFFNNKLWVLGGFNNAYKNDIWSSTDGKNWVQEVAKAPWSGCWSHHVVIFNNKMYLIGGYGSSNIRDVWSSPDGINWTQETATTPWTIRFGHQVVVFNNKMWLMGGYASDNVNDIWSSTDGKNWVQETASAAWKARHNHSLVVFNNKIYLIGGRDYGDIKDVWSSTDGKNWIQETTTTPWTGRTSIATVVFNNKIYIIAGITNTSPPVAHNDVWSSTDGKTWVQETASAAWGMRYGHACLVFNNKINLLGGVNFDNPKTTHKNDMWVSEDGATWIKEGIDTSIDQPLELTLKRNDKTRIITLIRKAIPENRVIFDTAGRHTVTVPEGVNSISLGAVGLPMIAGGTSAFKNNIPVKAGQKLEVVVSDTRKLRNVVSTTVPWEGRMYHQVVIFNNKLWVIGGKGSNDKNDVWSSTDGKTWVQETASAQWSARAGHQVVVLNNKMYLMGGYADTYKNDVWSSTDGKTWVQETSAAQWSARSNYQVAVFKNKMWVIGGYDKTYTLKSDVWSSTDGKTWVQETSSAAWGNRHEHQVAILNNKMYLMGGFNNAYKNDVWSSTDGKNWVQETASAAWKGRHRHRSITFKGKLWLIGGQSNIVGDFKDVWSSTDGKTWVQETASAQWSARYAHQIAIFKNKMWVIGGYTNGSDRVNDIWNSLDGKNWNREFEEEFIPANRPVNLIKPFKDKSLRAVGVIQKYTSFNAIPLKLKSEESVGTALKEQTFRKALSDAQYIVVENSNTLSDGIYYFGGLDPNKLNSVYLSRDDIDSDIWRLDVNGNWTLVDGGNYPLGLWRPIAVYFKGKIWVIGGMYNNNAAITHSQSVWSTEDFITWTEHKNSLPYGSSFQYTPAITVHDNKIWIAGLTVGKNYAGVYTSEDGINWVEQAKDGLVFSQVVNPKLIVVGDTFCYFNRISTAYHTSKDGKTWTQKEYPSVIKSKIKKFHNVFHFNNKLYFTLGVSESALINEFGLFSLASDLETATEHNTGTRFEPRYDDTIISLKNTLFSLDGRIDKGHLVERTLKGTSPEHYLSSQSNALPDVTFDAVIVEYLNKLWYYSGTFLAKDPSIGNQERSFNNHSIWESSDGESWDMRTSGYNNRKLSVAYPDRDYGSIVFAIPYKKSLYALTGNYVEAPSVKIDNLYKSTDGYNFYKERALSLSVSIIHLYTNNQSLYVVEENRTLAVFSTKDHHPIICIADDDGFRVQNINCPEMDKQDIGSLIKHKGLYYITTHSDVSDSEKSFVPKVKIFVSEDAYNWQLLTDKTPMDGMTGFLTFVEDDRVYYTGGHFFKGNFVTGISEKPAYSTSDFKNWRKEYQLQSSKETGLDGVLKIPDASLFKPSPVKSETLGAIRDYAGQDAYDNVTGASSGQYIQDGSRESNPKGLNLKGLSDSTKGEGEYGKGVIPSLEVKETNKAAVALIWGKDKEYPNG